MSDGKKRIGKTAFSVGSAILVLVIVILVNILFSRVNWRWDATEGHLYSLSPGTRSILENLKQDVVIKVFYSKHEVNVPSQIKTFAQRVIDFLSEYEHDSKGRLSVEIYDPQPDSEEEDWAVKYGMKSIDLQDGDKAYLGLVALSADQEAAIPFIDPTQEKRLEYDITRIITQVQTAKRKKIAVYSSLPIFGSQSESMAMGGMQQEMPPWFFVQQLKKSYDLVQVQPDAERIDPTADLLVLFHPRNMSDSLAFAVDQYILGGGNAIVFADPLSLMDDPRMGPGGSIPGKLFKAWGISMPKGKAVADYNYATQLRNRSNQLETNPLWLSAPAGAFNSKDMITADLDSMLFPVAGAIEKLPNSPYRFEPLVQSSPNNEMMDAMSHSLDVDTLRQRFKPSGVVRDLAVRITGKFKTAFPDGKPEKQPKGGQKASVAVKKAQKWLKVDKTASVIVVVGDSDLLYDGYYMQRQNLLGYTISNIFNDNLNFLLNTCEMLTGNPALIRIRSRGTFERPFTRVQALQQKAQDRWLDKEQALVRQAKATNRKLDLLQRQKDATEQSILSEAQQKEIERFQAKKVKINHELKIVRRNLRADIERLGNTVKFVNIFLVPLLIGIGGIVFAIVRRRKA